eukprot:1897234-Amphidinium_carterae.1
MGQGLHWVSVRIRLKSGPREDSPPDGRFDCLSFGSLQLVSEGCILGRLGTSHVVHQECDGATNEVFADTSVHDMQPIWTNAKLKSPFCWGRYQRWQ